MKDYVKYFAGGIIAAILVIFLFNYQNNKLIVPAVGVDGKIEGNYAIEGIMRLGKPYECTFEKTDGASRIAGIIHTDSKNIYGEFRIKTDQMKDEFNSFLITKDEEAYIWTSLQNIGYKSPIAKSASKNASPVEQTQIVGMRDEMAYKCELWLDADSATFETPTWITFLELKK